MPYKPTIRQYRDFSVKELRATEPDEESKSYVVEGYFTTFDDEYMLEPGYYEVIDRNAFDGSDLSDVLFQMNHDGFVYARIRNGSLSVDFDEHGGHFVADLSGSKQGREDLHEAISNGLIDRMSFGFTIANDGFEWYEDEEGEIHSRVTKIAKLFDVSAIAGFPANEDTQISARSYLDASVEARHRMEEEEERKASEQRSRLRRRALALELHELELRGF